MKLKGMKAGKYRVKADILKGYILNLPFGEATVGDKGAYNILIQFDFKKNEKEKMP